MNGCTNPAAVNYNGAADTEDFSCIYLEKYAGICYAFEDVGPADVKEESLTLSFSHDGDDWVFFHDYIPDFYFSSREQLYTLKNNRIYKHNAGAPGVYYDPAPKPFFIDVVFRFEDEVVLNSLQWVTEVINNDQEVEFSTLTHITIWNNQQCTGRIPVSTIMDQLDFTTRKTKSLWSFNSFRDMIKTRGSKFLLNIFNNFAVDTTKLDSYKPWFDQDLLHDSFFIVRLEFDNSSGNRLVLHEADVDVSKSYR